MRELISIRRTYLAFAALALLAGSMACGLPSSGLSLPDIEMPSLSSTKGENLAECPTPKCLTVYLAPWCGYCRAATPIILETREYLKDKNVTMRIVIGMDEPRKIQEYAQVFGKDTLLDINGSMTVKGVPHFYVTNRTGEILKDVGGYPQGMNTPQEFAGYFGLP